MKSPSRSTLAVALAIAVGVSACQPGNGPGNRPYAFRSVLDWEPRILTIQLDSTFWVAYDAENASLFKVWRDGVDLEGAVYTAQHGPQPTAVGPAWMVNPFRKPWRVVTDGDTLKPHVQYRGHAFADGGVRINSELTLEDGTVISVSEKPSKIVESTGNPKFVREFDVDGVPGGSSLLLETEVNGLNQPGELTSNGELIGQENGSEWSGWLVLNPNGVTKLMATLSPDPPVPQLIEEGPDTEAPRGRRLMDATDCKVCHNPDVETVGPAFKEIAARYTWSTANVERLVSKVINGGSGVWGDRMMIPHPTLSRRDVAAMVGYIMSLDGEQPPIDEGNDSIDLLATPADSSGPHGLVVNVYRYDHDLASIPTPAADAVPVISTVAPYVNATNRADFGGLADNFSMHFRGKLEAPTSGRYTFRLISDDGAILKIDGRVVIDHGGLHGSIPPKEGSAVLRAGAHSFTLDFFQQKGGRRLTLEWQVPGSSDFVLVPSEAFTYDRADLKEVKPYEPPPEIVVGIPGDGQSLRDVHPSFDLFQARPDSFHPKVGGLDFLPDGRLVVSTWDPDGSVYIVDGMKVKRIAKGLAEPLGLKVVDGEIYVLQKQELTKLIDHNGDEIIDEFYAVSNDWRVSSNFHEFAFGLVYQDGHFYGTLATDIEPGGASTQPQVPDRGKVMRIDPATGDVEFVASGLRVPNGIGIGLGTEIFIADNQGDWLPSSKIVHLQKGAWYGSRAVDFEGTEGKTPTPPVVWLPHGEVSYSPSTPVGIEVGPYAGQLINGDVTHGGIKRVFVEEVDGQLQGAVFRFTQGLEAGVNRLVWGPNGDLYIGEIGNPGNWSQEGKLWYGLQRLHYNGKATFEMLSVRSMTGGLEIAFTDALRPGDGWSPDDYLIEQWWYKPTAEYGGPKMDVTQLTIKSVNISDDRRRVFLEVPGLKEGHVVYIRLKAPFVSDSGLELWSTEAWYTLNKIPTNRMGFRSANPVAPTPRNVLSELEIDEGWKPLFDGESFAGWHKYGGGPVGSAWKVIDGAMTLVPGQRDDWQAHGGGDIVTDDEFEDFDLSLEWKIAPGGNSGIMYLVKESDEFEYPWQTGLEMQVLDSKRHPDGRIFKHRAGDLYDLVAAKYIATREVGDWNQVHIVKKGPHVDQWLNGHLVVSVDLWTDEWNALVAGSKFAAMPAFGTMRAGKISLQDHGDRVAYRNVKILPLR